MFSSRLTDALHITNGAKIREAAMRGDVAFVKRYIATHQDKVEALNRKDEKNKTALYIAAQKGHLEVVQALIAAKADLNLAPTSGATPLLIAALQGHLEVVQALITAKANLNAASTSGDTPLHIAAQEGHLEVVLALIEAGADLNAASTSVATPLLFAARHGHLEVVQALIAAGADLNAAHTDGATPLYIAAQEGHLEVVQALIAAGADLNAAHTDDATPLYIAAQEGHLEVVRALINNDADLNRTFTNSSGKKFTPLQIANSKGHNDIVALIRKKLSPPSFEDRLNKINFEGDIPHDLCCPIDLFGIMNDPITVSTGITYDRESLRNYFENKGNPNSVQCPLTKEPILITDLTNKTAVFVKGEIEKFVAEQERIAHINQQESRTAITQAVEDNTQNTSTQSSKTPETIEALRAARLKYFSSTTHSLFTADGANILGANQQLDAPLFPDRDAETKQKTLV